MLKAPFQSTLTKQVNCDFNMGCIYPINRDVYETSGWAGSLDKLVTSFLAQIPNELKKNESEDRDYIIQTGSKCPPNVISNPILVNFFLEVGQK